MMWVYNEPVSYGVFFLFLFFQAVFAVVYIILLLGKDRICKRKEVCTHSFAHSRTHAQ